MKKMLLLLLLVPLGFTLRAEPRKFNLPPEKSVYPPGEGQVLAQALCLSCHSPEYCSMQPPLPEKYWDATLKKMKEKFGATIPDEAMPVLLKYLVSTYGKAP